MSRYKSVIFDLDGTLLNTLPDLMNSVNYVLKKNGQPERTYDEIRRFVGNGIRKLMERATPDDISDELFEKEYKEFQDRYQLHCMDETVPYDGITELLRYLNKNNIKTAIVSNKNDAAVQKLYQHYFSDKIDTARGIIEGMKTKPNPDVGMSAMREIGADKETTLYIGDSDVDAATAKNLGLDCILVSWGFKDRDFLEQFDVLKIADTADDIIRII
jgi:phosphoglycolate phosphatase